MSYLRLPSPEERARRVAAARVRQHIEEPLVLSPSPLLTYLVRRHAEAIASGMTDEQFVASLDDGDRATLLSAYVQGKATSGCTAAIDQFATRHLIDSNVLQ